MMENTKQFIEWDSGGAGYGQCHEDSLSGVHQLVVRRIVEHDCRSVLDFGCGHGRLAERLIKAGVGVSLYDINDKLLALAQQRCSKELVSAFSDLGEISEDHFDCVVLSVVLVCSPSKTEFEATLRSAVSKLKRGGLLVIVETHPAFRDQMFSDFFAAYAKGKPFEYHVEEQPFTVALKAGDKELIMGDYHYTIGTLINAIVSSGCQVTHVEEPRDGYERPSRNEMKPPYIVVEARRARPRIDSQE